MAWWPRQTPSSGTLPASARTSGTAIPASAGVHGPGEITATGGLSARTPGTAMASFWVKVKGLLGPHGILPAEQFLQAVREHHGVERFRLVPTLFWLRADGTALVVGCLAGIVAAVLVLFNVWPTVNHVLCWA